MSRPRLEAGTSSGAAHASLNDLTATMVIELPPTPYKTVETRADCWTDRGWCRPDWGRRQACPELNKEKKLAEVDAVSRFDAGIDAAVAIGRFAFTCIAMIARKQ